MTKKVKGGKGGMWVKRNEGMKKFRSNEEDTLMQDKNEINREMK